MAQTGFLMVDAESGCSCRMSISRMRTYIHSMYMYDVQMHKCVDIATTALRVIRRSQRSERRANLAISEAHDASLTAQYPWAARFSRTSVRASDDLSLAWLILGISIAPGDDVGRGRYWSTRKLRSGPREPTLTRVLANAPISLPSAPLPANGSWVISNKETTRIYQKIRWKK